ncbi:MAG: TetR/AcrR family transcriptional regulator [Acaryochloridaceae cyanobacterium CSU_3_4]|nr:TetR/AcrR family transcriptional regulator [Acaryochloris sp. SU_5_25]NJN37521.1 TetR/AcrR family transcriptional regulator [Acaryochloridaceae cyanobacterium CSU_3_4]
MQLSSRPTVAQTDLNSRILAAAQHLFARQGFEKTTTRQLAEAAGIAEGTLFRHFENKKAILVAVVTQGWSEMLTDLLIQLSEMGSYRSVAQMMRERMLSLHKQADLMRVCFMEAQFHPDLRDRIQTEIINKMTSVVEAFIQTGIERGTYRSLNPKVVARVFLGMFMIAGFSQNTLMDEHPSLAFQQEMAETLADIFLNGVLVQS